MDGKQIKRRLRPFLLRLHQRRCCERTNHDRRIDTSHYRQSCRKDWSITGDFEVEEISRERHEKLNLDKRHRQDPGRFVETPVQARSASLGSESAKRWPGSLFRHVLAGQVKDGTYATLR
jgi:hypothetical protein